MARGADLGHGRAPAGQRDRRAVDRRAQHDHARRSRPDARVDGRSGVPVAVRTAVTTSDEGRPSPRSLLEQLEESERVFAETGRYRGIEQLELKQADPLRYDRLFSRLHSTVVAAREGARRIAASPGVREVGEM